MINIKKTCALLKKSEGKFISIEAAASMLGLNEKFALDALTKLEQDGFIDNAGVDGYWMSSIKGKLLVHRKSIKEFKTETARKHLSLLLERAQLVNSSTKFPDYITCLKITSKYPIEQPCQGLDIVFSLARKKVSEKQYDLAAIRLRKQHNKQFDNLVEYYFYPHTAIKLFLKSRSHILQLKQWTISEIKQIEGHIIFEK